MDVSFGFLTRIPFKKKVKSSKLDSLLERRLKQHTIEEGQRQQLSVSNPQTPAPISSPTASALNTPASTLSPIRPHNVARTQLALEKNVKVETPSRAETPGSLDVGAQQVLSPVLGSTLRDGCSTCTGDDSVSPQNQLISLQGLKGDLMGRTTRPMQSISEGSGQDSAKHSNEEKTSSEGIHSSMEKETKTEEHNIKLDIVRIKRCSQNTAPPKPNQQSTEAFRSVHSGTEKNGMGPVENNENMQDVKRDITEGDGTLKSVSPLPQVNGNDGPGSDSVLCSSVVSSNNCMLANSTQPRTNSFGKGGEQRLGLLLKDSVQQKPLVNGDLTQVNKDGGVKGPNQTSKPDMDCEKATLEQDYQPPVKLSRVDNNVDAREDAQCSQHHSRTPPLQSEENIATPVCKIIRMAPSPIPSAEESSLSNDFTEVFSQTRTAEPITTIITQVATTSITTTTTVVSKQTKIVPSKTSEDPFTPVVSRSESSAVSTLSTMTKTTVTKICSSGLDSQSEDSQSETVTQDQKMSVTSTVSPSGKVSVSSVTVSQEHSSTKGRVRLLRFSRTKKTRSDTALPSYCKFVTKSDRKSIFVLPHDDLKVLGRRGGFRDVPIFSYNAKPAWDIWPYPSPRPTFGLTWR